MDPHIEIIHRAIEVPLSAERAFGFFTEHFALWWPREYTWGQEVVEDIGIEPREGGLCFERGPYGFRCDWGRVLSWEPPRRLVLAWQISARREPQPNPAKASTLEVTFAADTPQRTRVLLEHRDFERHGDGAPEVLRGTCVTTRLVVDSRSLRHRRLPSVVPTFTGPYRDLSGPNRRGPAACCAPIPQIQADTDPSDCSQRDKRQGICSIRTQTDPEHFMDHELDV